MKKREKEVDIRVYEMREHQVWVSTDEEDVPDIMLEIRFFDEKHDEVTIDAFPNNIHMTVKKLKVFRKAIDKALDKYYEILREAKGSED